MRVTAAALVALLPAACALELARARPVCMKFGMQSSRERLLAELDQYEATMSRRHSIAVVAGVAGTAALGAGVQLMGPKPDAAAIEMARAEGAVAEALLKEAQDQLHLTEVELAVVSDDAGKKEQEAAAAKAKLRETETKLQTVSEIDAQLNDAQAQLTAAEASVVAMEKELAATKLQIARSSVVARPVAADQVVVEPSTHLELTRAQLGRALPPQMVAAVDRLRANGLASPPPTVVSAGALGIVAGGVLAAAARALPELVPPKRQKSAGQRSSMTTEPIPSATQPTTMVQPRTAPTGQAPFVAPEEEASRTAAKAASLLEQDGPASPGTPTGTGTEAAAKAAWLAQQDLASSGGMAREEGSAPRPPSPLVAPSVAQTVAPQDVPVADDANPLLPSATASEAAARAAWIERQRASAWRAGAAKKPRGGVPVASLAPNSRYRSMVRSADERRQRREAAKEAKAAQEKAWATKVGFSPAPPPQTPKRAVPVTVPTVAPMARHTILDEAAAKVAWLTKLELPTWGADGMMASPAAANALTATPVASDDGGAKVEPPTWGGDRTTAGPAATDPMIGVSAVGDEETAKQAWLAKLDAPAWGDHAVAADPAAADPVTAVPVASDFETAKAAWLSKLDAPAWGDHAVATDPAAADAAAPAAVASDEKAAKAAWLAKLDAPAWGGHAVAADPAAADPVTAVLVPAASDLEAAKQAWLAKFAASQRAQSSSGVVTPSEAPSPVDKQEVAKRAWLASVE